MGAAARRRRQEASRSHAYGAPSETEKHHDRNSAMETLRAIIALDYRIDLADSG
jgi:hypothetical protein